MDKKLLKKKRESCGLTQKQAAQEVGTTERAYQYYEAGQREPSVRTAIRIADVLGVKTYEEFKKMFS